MIMQLPVEIREQHQGEWIAWDTQTGELLGAAQTYDQLADMIEPKCSDRVIGYERVIPDDVVIVGGFWG
jgi:hypothetical protein